MNRKPFGKLPPKQGGEIQGHLGGNFSRRNSAILGSNHSASSMLLDNNRGLKVRKIGTGKLSWGKAAV